jgi:hypothetical protein
MRHPGIRRRLASKSPHFQMAVRRSKMDDARFEVLDPIRPSLIGFRAYGVSDGAIPLSQSFLHHAGITTN